MTEQPNNQEWVILEAMGHRTTAGRYSFENGLHRVDVPDVSPEAEPGAFVSTQRFGGEAIYCITTVDEATARKIARECQVPDAIPFDLRRELRKLAGPGEQLQLLPRDAPIVEPEDEDDEGYGFNYPTNLDDDYPDVREDYDDDDPYDEAA